VHVTNGRASKQPQVQGASEEGEAEQPRYFPIDPNDPDVDHLLRTIAEVHYELMQLGAYDLKDDEKEPE
jgi:hypothetical protein